MEGIHGWKIDLKTTYGSLWRDKEKFHLREYLYESPDKNFAALLYGIAEIGVSKEIGRLALFRNKEKPELIANLPHLICWYLYGSSLHFGQKDVIFIHRFKSVPGRNTIELCALDHARRRLVRLNQLPEGFYDIRHVEEQKYAFTRAAPDAPTKETLIDLKAVEWEPLSHWTGRARALIRALMDFIGGRGQGEPRAS